MRRIQFVTIVVLLLTVLPLLASSGEDHRKHERGTLTVYNYTDRKLSVVVDSTNQGYIERGSYASYDVRCGHHIVYGSWDTGSTKKYANVDPYWGYDYCYFYQRDIY